MLDFQEMNRQTRLPKPEQHSPLAKTGATLPVTHWHRPLQRLDTLATVCGGELFLTTPSPARFLRFHRRNYPSPSHPLWAVQILLTRSQLSLVLLPKQDKTEGVFLLQRLWRIVPHPSLFGAPSLALFPFLTSGPDLGVWPDCWVFVEFFHAPIPRKGRVGPPPLHQVYQLRGGRCNH